MKVILNNKTITERPEIKSFLDQYGIYIEFWNDINLNHNLSDPLEKYKESIEKLKQKFNYVSADCCSLNSSNTNLDNILKPFMTEHHHTDDEVRFTVEGEGIFGICPKDKTEFEIHVEPGDLILIPANVRHWFKLTDKKNICCLRIFKENPKWEAVY